MSDLPAPLERLVEQLVRLPGIGRRSAQRIAYHIARLAPEQASALATAVRALEEELAYCSRCGNLTESTDKPPPVCGICTDGRRDAEVLCVVEQPENIAAIERTGAFGGRYHVLGGAISPLHSIGPEELRIEPLAERIQAESIKEVIVATNPTIEGEATALYLARRLSPSGVKVSRPATGLPVGGELEFIDRSTLSRAFEGRRDL